MKSPLVSEMASQKCSSEIEAMASGMANGCASQLLLVDYSPHHVRLMQEAFSDVDKVDLDGHRRDNCPASHSS
jgi:hypothetical protein